MFRRRKIAEYLGNLGSIPLLRTPTAARPPWADMKRAERARWECQIDRRLTNNVVNSGPNAPNEGSAANRGQNGYGQTQP
jgi:hypothetical protein